MIWDYRVVCGENGQFSLREVFYERDGRLIAYSQEPVKPQGASLEDLSQEVRWFKEALNLPVLTAQELDAEIAAHPPRPKAEPRRTYTRAEVEAELAKRDAANANHSKARRTKQKPSPTRTDRKPQPKVKATAKRKSS